MKKSLVTIIFHTIGWIIFLSLPLLFLPKRPEMSQHETGNFIFLPAVITGLILIFIFYFNYFVLIPGFLFRQKNLTYILLCIGIVAVIFVLPRLVISFHPLPNKLPRTGMEEAMPLVVTNLMLMFIVTFLASTGLRLNNRWKQTEKERLSAQLSYLKMQINPHFLFNTLNSIYSVTIGKAPQAAEMVDKLSGMMRYTLKETQLDFVPLEMEIEYITNYIDLQRVRLDKSVKVNLEVKGDYEGYQIAPLLLIPFIENAFKHGVNSEQDSDIKVSILANDMHELCMTVTNNKVMMEKIDDEDGGLGIENTRSRLQLIYPGKHYLNISETEEVFTVLLQIHLR